MAQADEHAQGAHAERSAPDHIEVHGNLGTHSVPGLLDTTEGWFSEGQQTLTVDLANVSRTDSAGVALLLDWWRTARAHATELTYRNAPRQMHAIVDFCGLDAILPLEQ